jgi:hypothetical protein
VSQNPSAEASSNSTMVATGFSKTRCSVSVMILQAAKSFLNIYQNLMRTPVQKLTFF